MGIAYEPAEEINFLCRTPFCETFIPDLVSRLKAAMAQLCNIIRTGDNAVLFTDVDLFHVSMFGSVMIVFQG